MTPYTWINELLRNRDLTEPDGRPLYAYRCTALEFRSLAGTLVGANINAEATIRAFVVYAAEWWQRHYDGSHWAWEPLLESLQWDDVHYPDLYLPVRSALRWWRVDLVRLHSGNRYLSTFACQGGLALALVGDANSRVTQFLRAVLRHTAAYGQFVEDAVDLARDQQHLLRPPTLRRDYVFRLAADLAEAVLNLQQDAQSEDPLNALDQTRPGWRETMPLGLDNERARELLTGLLREASRDRTAPVNDFRVERFLRYTGIGWRLGARVRLPASITADNLAMHLKVQTGTLPSRLQVRTPGDHVRVFGMYSAQKDDYILSSRATQSAIELWDAEAAHEIRLQFRAGDVIGEAVVPARGSALGDLPWSFRGDDHEAPFIGEGSVSNRAPKIFVLLPEDTDSNAFCPIDHDTVILGRLLLTAVDRTEIETIAGRCTITPSAGQGAEEDFRLFGQRLYTVESDWPLFRGVPRLRIATSDSPGIIHAVRTDEVSWRRTGQDWQNHPTGFGLWQVRHVRRGELRFHARVGILPDGFKVHLRPGETMTEGSVELTGAEGVRPTGQAEGAELTTQIDGNTLRINFNAGEAAVVPSRVALHLNWEGADALPIYAPFPGRGARFLRNGKPVDGAISVNDLYGVRATALSANATEQFWTEGELVAEDLTPDLSRVTFFRVPLRRSGLIRELPLIDLRYTIELLLGASASGHATVRLRIVDTVQRPTVDLIVRRFAGSIRYDDDSRKVVAQVNTVGVKPPTTFEAMAIARPDVAPVPISNAATGAEYPQALNLAGEGPWLVAASGADRAMFRPLVIPGQTDGHLDPPSLRNSIGLQHRESRWEAISTAMDGMIAEDDTNQDDDEWSFLTDTLLCADGLPPTAFDLIKVLGTKPRLLVRCMFRLEATPRQFLWRLDEQRPFSWLMISRDIWRTECARALDRLRESLNEVEDGDQIAQCYVRSILSEGADLFPELNTVFLDVSFKMDGNAVPPPIVAAALSKRDQQTMSQLTLRYSMDDWPRGYGRREWAREVEDGDTLLNLNIWQNEGNEGRSLERQPIFDTPVASAWCCFKSKPTDRTTFLVKRTRAHDPEWFDLVYRAAWLQLALMQDQGEI